MAWFKVDDGFAFHPKAIEAGNSALGLWVRAGAWCGANLTDGALPKHMIGTLGAQARDARKLVQVGLWVETETGYKFHEWGKMQPTKTEVEAERAHNRARQKAWRDKHRNAVIDAATDDVTNDAPTRPDPTLNKEKKDADASFPAGNVSELRTSKPTPIPADFTMTAPMQNWALRTIGTARNLNLELETEKFAAHAREKNITSASWPDSWRKWILKAMEFHDRDKANAGPATTEDLKALYRAPAMHRGKPLEEPA